MMHTLQEQLELENEMMASGVDAFFRHDGEAEKGGRILDTSYVRKLLPANMQIAVEAFDTFRDAPRTRGCGMNVKYITLFEKLSSEQLAFMTLRGIFGAFIEMKPMQHIAMNIGRAVEDERKMQIFKVEHEDSYNVVMAELRKTRTKSERHRHVVFNVNANRAGTTWNNWTPRERAGVGLICLKIVMGCTELVEVVKSKDMLYLKPSKQCMEWIRKYQDFAAVLSPKCGPCIIPPAPWESRSVGGYHSPVLRARVPMVKCRTKRQREAIDNADMPEVYSAVNAIQATAWEINADVHKVLKEVWAKNLQIGLPASQPYVVPPAPIPEGMKKEDLNEEQLAAFTDWKRQASAVYTMERLRISKCFQIVSLIHMADKYSKLGVLYFPMQADFRSRLYTTCPAWSPQGADYAKGLLRFKEGKKLTEAGVKWFLIHGANKYGYDKLTLTDRVDAILKLDSQILATVSDPISNRDFWAAADYPWQFLAWCYEYARFKVSGANTVSHIPVALDGSCNGLQHYSAMLRDPVGSSATNVMPNETPQDIYQEVADVVKVKLEQSADPLAKKWLEYGVTRSLVKKPVMTMPYGSTRDTCVHQITEHLYATDRNYFGSDTVKAVSLLATTVWQSIGEVVVAAREAMDWLKRSAQLMCKDDATTISWKTPVGFPVTQDERMLDTIRVECVMDKPRKFVIGSLGDATNKPKMKSGVAPNFVHSMDASHMMKTINAAAAEGITSFACIHDDYGVHAADTERFFNIIREQFVDMYSTHSPLEEFKEHQERLGYDNLGELPATGNLDINSVLDSKYFFS